MEIGFHFINFTPSTPGDDLVSNLVASVTAAEEVGCVWFTLADHMFQMEGLGHVAEEPFLEGYTTLGYLAAQTRRLQLGMLVTGVMFRYPGVLAKTVSTLDVLSGGRAILGLGAAWYEREHVGLGVPFPSTAERFERLEETLQICDQMWSSDNGSYRGQHYELAETLCLPAPVQRPHPPILIGGGGERKTLRLVAQYADIWNVPATSLEIISHKLDVLARHCAAIDRDPASIRKSVLYQADPSEDPDGFLAAMEQYAALGIDVVMVTSLASDPADGIRRLGDTVIPRLPQNASPAVIPGAKQYRPAT